MYHIIFLSPHSDPQAEFGEMDSGGQCVYEHQLALALSELPDVKVTTFCRQHYRRPDVSEVHNSYRIVRVKCGPPYQVRKEEIAAVLPEFAQFVKNYLLKYHQNESLIVHGHYWDGGLTALLLKTQWPIKLPFVWTPHSLGSLKQRKFTGASAEWFYNFIPRECWEGYSVHVADKLIISTDKEKEIYPIPNLEWRKVSFSEPVYSREAIEQQLKIHEMAEFLLTQLSGHLQAFAGGKDAYLQERQHIDNKGRDEVIASLVNMFELLLDSPAEVRQHYDGKVVAPKVRMTGLYSIAYDALSKGYLADRHWEPVRTILRIASDFILALKSDVQIDVPTSLNKLKQINLEVLKMPLELKKMQREISSGVSLSELAQILAKIDQLLTKQLITIGEAKAFKNAKFSSQIA